MVLAKQSSVEQFSANINKCIPTANSTAVQI